MVERMIQVTRRRKSGPTAGEEEQCQQQATRVEIWRCGHDHPNDRLQRGDRGVQELELHRAEGHRDDSLRENEERRSFVT